jgi:hypothetical protein
MDLLSLKAVAQFYPIASSLKENVWDKERIRAKMGLFRNHEKAIDSFATGRRLWFLKSSDK